jgi:hypothetical protein
MEISRSAAPPLGRVLPGLCAIPAPASTIGNGGAGVTIKGRGVLKPTRVRGRRYPRRSLGRLGIDLGGDGGDANSPAGPGRA